MSDDPIDRPRLLIVEDSPLDRDLYGRHLKGYQIAFASSGEEAVELLDAHPFDLILLDNGLPGMDGGEVIDAVRVGQAAETPIIVVTGAGSDRLAADLLGRGADDYVTKDDLTTPRIASTIAGAVKRHRLARARQAAESEVRAQRDQLEATLRQLREAQAHLVQSEKMAGLGQIVAGVAHEINNPIAYVSNNLAVLARDARHLAGLVALYRAELEGKTPPSIASAEARIDLDYTLENLNRLVTSSQQGLARVREIVGSLRDFSRLDEAERKEIDPNEVVRDTLEIVRHAIRQKGVDLRVDLADLPRLRCAPAKLNQVLLNMILNAIQAVEAGARIDLTTRADPDRSEIIYEIADTGPGIPPEARDRIFDPFFTTKAPGVGTGLGLWVCYNIIRDHGGRIELDTEVGKGTTFRVILPTDLAPDG